VREAPAEIESSRFVKSVKQPPRIYGRINKIVFLFGEKEASDEEETPDLFRHIRENRKLRRNAKYHERKDNNARPISGIRDDSVKKYSQVDAYQGQ